MATCKANVHGINIYKYWHNNVSIESGTGSCQYITFSIFMYVFIILCLLLTLRPLHCNMENDDFSEIDSAARADINTNLYAETAFFIIRVQSYFTIFEINSWSNFFIITTLYFFCKTQHTQFVCILLKNIFCRKNNGRAQMINETIKWLLVKYLLRNTARCNYNLHTFFCLNLSNRWRTFSGLLI